VAKGLEVMEGLRGWTSGLAVPYYVIDAPGGGGKVPLLPSYVVYRDDKKIVVRNFRGTEHTYWEPEE
jgi:lysine 2,3-aminomutase